ncbi:hypothetical protein MKK70_12950 [Methylobacterium sp. E-041]|uniref:hypothetical protein n=1 Tax=Methylobacterium sp. E-041 TaxID=2836573 RepID=UPI001FB9DFDD|nr:hypothetical protein [Methylobacterium sp. E-041]MCJ2106270.1 hypothetical protein [Methylobacterium sp. E-041]
MDIRAGFAVLRARFGLPPHAARDDAPFCWGEEKLTAHRHRLERQLAAIATEHRAVMRDHDRRTGDLQRRRDACLIELAMTDLHALATQRQGNSNAAESAPAPGALAPPARGKTGGVPNGPGSAETPPLPADGLDPGNTPPVPASLSVAAPGSAPDHAPPGAPILPDPASTAPAEAEAEDPWEQDDCDSPDDVPSLAAIMDRVDELDEEEPRLDLKALYALVAASTPGWLDVDAPPPCASARFPLCGMRIGDQWELSPLNLGELMPLLPEIGNIPPSALPSAEDEVLTWLWSDEGAGYREPVQLAIWREQARRFVWADLLEWYGLILALAPGGPGGTTTPEEAEEKFTYYEDWYRKANDPVLHPVWDELVMLLPGRPWLASGAGLQAVPNDDGSDISAYEDDDPEDAGST